MIIWTPTVLSVLYACVLYFCICTCSAQLSMFHMERRSRNTLIIIIITITTLLLLVIIKIIMIIIKIALKGATRDFLQSPHCIASCLQHVCISGKDATVCKSLATLQALMMCNMCASKKYFKLLFHESIFQTSISLHMTFYDNFKENSHQQKMQLTVKIKPSCVCISDYFF